MIRSRVQRHLARLKPDWDVSAIDDVEFLEGGYGNDNFAFDYGARRYVLRLPLRPQPFVDHAHEHWWYSHLPANVGVQPEVHDAETGMMLSRMVAGTPLAELSEPPPIAVLAAYLRDLHASLPQPRRGYPLQDMLTVYFDSDPDAQVVPGGFDAVPCHNDLNPWNILVTPQGWLTLDWEFVGNHDPLFDLVSLHQGLDLAPDLLPALADAYRNKDVHRETQPLGTVLKQFWLRELGWAQYQWRLGNRRAEIESQITRARETLASLG